MNNKLHKACVIAILLATVCAACALDLTWDAPTSNEDGTPITEPLTYNLYEDGELVQSNIPTNAASVDLDRAGKVSVSWTVTAIVDGWESDHSAAYAIHKPGKPGKPAKQK